MCSGDVSKNSGCSLRCRSCGFNMNKHCGVGGHSSVRLSLVGSGCVRGCGCAITSSGDGVTVKSCTGAGRRRFCSTRLGNVFGFTEGGVAMIKMSCHSRDLSHPDTGMSGSICATSTCTRRRVGL